MREPRARERGQRKDPTQARETNVPRSPIGRWPSADSARPGVAPWFTLPITSANAWSLISGVRVYVRKGARYYALDSGRARPHEPAYNGVSVPASVEPGGERSTRSSEIRFLEWQTLNGDWLYRANRRSPRSWPIAPAVLKSFALSISRFISTSRR